MIYGVSDIIEDGFKTILNKPAQEDTIFNWNATQTVK